VKITETEAYVANWPVFAAKELDALRAERDALEADYRRIIIEVLACDPLPASQQPDDQLEPPLRATRDQAQHATDGQLGLRDLVQHRRPVDHLLILKFLPRPTERRQRFQ
jgi:hypothetical protein